jgi:hypothetical protein
MPAENVGHVPLTVGSFVGVMLFVSVGIPLLEPEPPLELLVVPPELPPLELLVVPLELPPPLEDPPELVELVEVVPEPLPLPELLDPLEPLWPLELLVFKPTSEPLPLPLRVDPVPAPASIGELLELPEVPDTGPVTLSTGDPFPLAAQPGAHPAAPTSKANMQPDSVRSNRFTTAP